MSTEQSAKRHRLIGLKTWLTCTVNGDFGAPMKLKFVIFKNPYEVELFQEPLPQPGGKEVLIKTPTSAINPGSEMLVYRDLFPPDLPVDTTIKPLARPFNYPLKYGYSSVGQVVEIGRAIKREWLGCRVFCFHRHESHYLAKPDDLISIPDRIESDEAVLAAN